MSMSQIELPPAMARLAPDLESIVAGIEDRADYGAAWLGARQGLRITVEDEQELVEEQPPAAGTVLTAFDGRQLHEVAAGSFDRQAVERAAQQLVRRAARAGDRTIDPGPERQGAWQTAADDAGESLSVADKLERCRELHRRVRRRDPRIVNIQVTYREGGELSVFRNRAADLVQRVQRVSLDVAVAVGGADGVRYSFADKGGTGGWELLQWTDEELQTVVDEAVALLGAERIEPGEYTVITAPGVSGSLCHESFGHGVETDMFLKQRARAADYIDRVVGSPLIDIWDDPGYARAFGGYFFDDEGEVAKPAQIVEQGVFRRGITDLYSSLMLGIPRTANGRRQDWSRKAYARMSNTFFGPGTTPVADLFAQVERGVYLEKWSSGMEDPKGWGIQVTCHFGREIVNGRVTSRMFAPVGISGYVPDVLASVSGVGADVMLDVGGCGKGHKEWLAVSAGGPHLLLKARLG